MILFSLTVTKQISEVRIKPDVHVYTLRGQPSTRAQSVPMCKTVCANRTKKSLKYSPVNSPLIRITHAN